MEELKNKKIDLLVSFSGGLTSGRMSKYIIDNYKHKYNLHFVFANTGKERPETLEFVRKCDLYFNMNLHYIEAKFLKEHGKKNWFEVKTFDTLSRKGEPFEAFIKKERIPNKMYPNCSGRLKQIPIHKFARYYLGLENYKTAIGIRVDERHRVNWASAKERGFIYPLITDIPTTSLQVRKFWEKMPFTLNLKDYEGNCDLCYKKSTRKLLTLIESDPSLLDWWNEMEIKFGDGYTFFRDNNSAIDLLEMSKKPFRRAVDKMDLHYQSPQLFDSMDFESKCSCGEI